MNINKYNILKVGVAGAMVLVAGLPFIAFAEQKNLAYLVNLAVQYINVFVYLILSLAFLVFVWNIYNYFIKADAEGRKDAGMYVLYSVIGFFVILSFWGLVNILSNTLKLDTTKPSGVGGQTSSSASGVFGGTQYGVGYQLNPASSISPGSSNTSGGSYYPGGISPGSSNTGGSSPISPGSSNTSGDSYYSGGISPGSSTQ